MDEKETLKKRILASIFEMLFAKGILTKDELNSLKMMLMKQSRRDY